MADSRKILARERKHRMYRARAERGLGKSKSLSSRSHALRDGPKPLPPAPVARRTNPIAGGVTSGGVGWNHDAPTGESAAPNRTDGVSVSARVLALLAEPHVDVITVSSAVAALGVPRPDVMIAIATLVQSGVLVERGEGTERRYALPPDRKRQLETLYADTAEELGEATLALMPAPVDTQLLALQDDVPRLPVTAGLLSLFLPGTGQLLNGDIARASLLFAVWSLAFLMQFLPIWFFVSLYAGAEAFFTAKLRGMERELANDTDGHPTSPSPG
ncbi:MAG: hypothetical protein B7733_07730 [Myxococcales bacterium FL481]|nr:MAG: hypothetical protein B7733_07730 [Myxococcales bacterium FL481]